MKKRIPVRILTALGGLVLLALCVCVAAEGFAGQPLTAATGAFLASGSVLAVLGKILLTLALLGLAVAAIICALPARRVKQSDFVMQRGENGPIGISVKAIEKKVLACVAKHEEIAEAEVSVREVREGIVILLNVDQVSGVSIPLSVGLLQKQIRQYVTDCTGVDVAEVRVMVENRTDAHVASAFGVEDTVCPAPVKPVEEFRQEAQPVQEDQVEQIEMIARIVQQPVEEAPVEEMVEEPAEEFAAPAMAVEILEELPELQEEPAEAAEDERPLHQRVFGAEEEELVVPMPPVMTVEPAAAPAEEPEQPAEEPEAPEVEAEESVEELPAESTEEPAEEPVEEDWTEPSLQAAAEAVLAAETTEVPAEDEPAAEEDAQEENEEEEPVILL